MTYHYKSLLILLTCSIGVSSFAAGFTLYAKDDFYQNQDRIDSSKSKSSHYLDLGIALDDIGGSGVSFHSDALYSNGLSVANVDGITRASAPQPLRFTTGYLDWQKDDGNINIRLGRQIYNSLAVETFDIDGLKFVFAPSSATRCNAAVGMIVPTPTKSFPASNFASGSILTADIVNTSLPFTTLTGAFASEKTLHEENDVRAALGISLTPSELVQFDGSGRFSTGVNGLDHIDAQLSFFPSSAKASLYFLSERGRVDSLNYFTTLMFEKINETGILFDYYPDGNSCIQGGYHASTIAHQGTDHFFLVNAANQVVDFGVTFSTGYHGTSFRPHGNMNVELGKYLSFKGFGEYCFFDETDIDDKSQVIVLSAGLKGAFFPLGFTIYPKIEYVSNRFYKQDVRFLVTTSLLIHNYWTSR